MNFILEKLLDPKILPQLLQLSFFKYISTYIYTYMFIYKHLQGIIMCSRTLQKFEPSFILEIRKWKLLCSTNKQIFINFQISFNALQWPCSVIQLSAYMQICMFVNFSSCFPDFCCLLLSCLVFEQNKATDMLVVYLMDNDCTNNA